MKPRTHISLPILLVAGMATLMIASEAMAQQSGVPFPIVQPGINSVYRGPRFFDAGLRYMNLETVKVVVNPYNNPGSVQSFNESIHPFANELWVPTIQAGKQVQNFFDLFGSFSWYSLTNATRIRQFSEVTTTVTQDISYHVDFSGYYLRAGGRSWYPMWGFGRLATSLGMINGLMPYKIDVTRAVAGELPRSETVNGYWYYFAGFAGVELEIGYRAFFGKTAVEYSVGTQPKRQLLSTVTYVNPEGLSVAISGGLRF